MASPFFTLLLASTLFSSFTYARPFRRQSGDNTDWWDRGVIRTKLTVGPTDENGERARRRNCIFYVNQQNLDSSDPNYAYNRALQFADLMNAAATPGAEADYHTLYDIYDTDAAFGWNELPTYSAMAAGRLRDWYRVTSAVYAELCEGTVYLIVEESPQEIWPGSIWITDELPTLMRPNSGVTQIVEIRPGDVGFALGNRPYVQFIPRHQYRGGQPPGATPPRDGEKSEIPANVGIDPKKPLDRVAGVPDVSGDRPPFKQGVCWMHVKQWKNPSSGGGSPFDNPDDAQWKGPYSVEITMWDDHQNPDPGNKIGYVARTNANDPDALHMKSKLEQELIVTPEEQNDYIDFRFAGGISFPSNDENFCKVGGWDRNTDRQMDCHFPCTWNGGDSSDHSKPGEFYP